MKTEIVKTSRLTFCWGPEMCDKALLGEGSKFE